MRTILAISVIFRQVVSSGVYKMAGSPRLNRDVGFPYHNIVGKCKIGLYPIAVLCVIDAFSVIIFSKCGGEWLPLLSSE